MNANGAIPPPNLRALLVALKTEIAAELNAHQIGEIVAFDAENQTATVKVMAQRVVYNQPQTEETSLTQDPTIVDYPLLGDVPVVVLSGGEGALTFPIESGDPCLVLFNDRDLDAWFVNGAAVPPNSSRLHSLSDGIALVGVRPLSAPLEDYDPENVVLRLGESRLRIKVDGTIEIERADGGRIAVESDGAIRALSSGGAQIELFADGTIALTAAGGANIAISDKIGANNGAESLLGVFTSLITALNALNAKTGPTAAPQIALAQTAITNLIQ